MNFKLHQPNLSGRAGPGPAPHHPSAAATTFGALWLAAACLLFGAAGSFAKDPFFSDLPVYQPPTNLVPFSLVTNATPLSGAAAAAAPAGTNATAAPAGTNATAAEVGTNAAPLISTNDMDALDDSYRLAIGDHISFRIEEDEDDPKQLTVTDSGDLEVPYIGRFAAAGKTCKQLARALKVELEKVYYYRATVIIAVDSMTKSRGIVYLVGAVRVPGPQDIPSDEEFTVSKAVLRAGGFTDYADKHNVRITHKGSATGAAEQSVTVNVGAILEKGKISSDVTLQAGDLIYIPERLVHF